MSRGGKLSRGKNAIRHMHSDYNDISDELHDARVPFNTSIFSRAVVEDVISLPEALSDDQIVSIFDRVKNPTTLDIIPRNTILARRITNSEDRRDPRPELVFPFFPPHLSLPVNPGEHVWLIDPDPDGQSEYSYWMCRVSDVGFVDDINFTHSDRRLFGRKKSPSTAEESGLVTNSDNSSSTGEGLVLYDDQNRISFPNGTGKKDGFSLREYDDFKKIRDNSSGNSILTREAVPRFTKRPGDTVIQGSNNSMIWLGEDRTGPIGQFNQDTGLPDGKVSEDISGKSGTIDVVVGRGRFGESETSPEETSPLVETNSRGEKETNKNPRFSNKTPNIREGDVDFKRDASRVYVSMKTNGDKNFEAQNPDKTDNSPESKDPEEEAYIIAKSDNIRIIARSDNENNILGSIKIIKEGDDYASFIIHEDATIQIDAPKIILGREDKTDGRSPLSDSPPTGYVKYSEYDKRMKEMHSLIEELRSIVESHGSNVTAFISAQIGATAGPIPVPTLQSSTSAYNALDSDFLPNVGSMKAKIETSKSKIPDARSDRIFGE